MLSVLQVLQDDSLSSDSQFKAIYGKVSKKVSELGGEIQIPRCSSHKRSQYRCNLPAENPEEYYRRSIFLPFLASMPSQMKLRFTKHSDILNTFSCLMACKEDRSEEAFLQLSTFYAQSNSNFSADESVLLSEYRLWMNTVNSQSLSVLEAYKTCCDLPFYPHIKDLFKIFVTLPVTTSTSERSFSAMKRLRSYLRNTMGNERLNGLALLNTHRHLSVSCEEVLQELMKKPRRVDFVL